MRVFRTALIYFALVFGAGFVLGALRVPFLVPRLGDRTAELLEAPFLFTAILLCARWVARRFAGTDRERVAVGLIAAALVLVADAGVGIVLRGLSPVAVFRDRDPVSGTVYYLLLGLFALMPWLSVRRRGEFPSGRRPG